MKSNAQKIRVLKFGGAALANADILRRTREIILSDPQNKVVVVSGIDGTTERLLEMSKKASAGDVSFRDDFKKVEKEHLEIARQMVPPMIQGSVLAEVKAKLNDLEDMLNGVLLLKELSPKTSDYILSFSETLSAFIVSQSIENGQYVDVRVFIRTDDQFGAAKVNLSESEKRIREWKGDGIMVVAGGVGVFDNTVTTRLGIGGSDYTAAIFAAALGAETLEIWKDVDGFKTANPLMVPSAYSITRMSYAEAMELSHFGEDVMYMPTIHPAYQKNIPIIVRNIFNPDFAGTVIDNGTDDQASIKGISSIPSIALLTIQGSGMVGVPGMSKRVFNALAGGNVNVILIAQASSEYSISFAVSPDDAEKAKTLLSNEFDSEISSGFVSIHEEKDMSIVAIVGENMRNAPGIAAKLFRILGNNGINVVAIAQGSSELNISVVVPSRALSKALNTIHEGFFIADVISLNLFVVGIGTVGGDLLKQIGSQQKKLEKEHRLRIRIVGVSNSRKMVLNASGIDLSCYRETLDKAGEKANLKRFVEAIKEYNLPNNVFVDCTANETVPHWYETVMSQYCSIVTANKIACSSAYENYTKLKKLAQKKNVKFLYETNVGAGLPIIRTINDLVKSGDRINKFEAVVSGTLNFIFNVLAEDVPMSKTIRMAQEAGYSEPDPRIDLSGKDVMRKLLILARECGYPLEAKDIAIKTFLPEKYLETKTLDEFWKVVPEADAEFETRRKALAAAGRRWRYVAKYENGVAETALQEVDARHPFYQLEGSDNIISLYTDRYPERPLVIKGAGAGAAVTATGVFSDIISIANV